MPREGRGVRIVHIRTKEWQGRNDESLPWYSTLEWSVGSTADLQYGMVQSELT